MSQKTSQLLDDINVADTDEFKVYFARDIAKRLITAIERLPQSHHRTSAHGRAEEVLAHLDRIADEQE